MFQTTVWNWIRKKTESTSMQELKKIYTSKVHRPRGSSPQVCVVMKGHLVKPSRPSSSLGRRLRIIDLKKKTFKFNRF